MMAQTYARRVVVQADRMNCTVFLVRGWQTPLVPARILP